MEFEFSKPFSIVGKWWIPGPEKKNGNVGTLTYDPLRGLTLTVDGSLFGPTTLQSSVNNLSIPWIHGRLKTGHCITLATSTGHELGSTEWLYTQLDVACMLVGNGTFLSPNKFHIDVANFYLNTFDTFLAGYEVTAKVEKPTEDTVTFTYKEKKQLDLIKNDSRHIYFFHSYNYTFPGIQDPFTLKERSFFNSEFAESISVQEAIHQLFVYKGFFTFFFGNAVHFSEANFYVKNSYGNLEGYQVIMKDPVSHIGLKVSRHDALLSYKEVKDEFASMLENFVKIEQFANNGLSLYLQVRNFQYPVTTQHFLNIVFATETLHNSFFNSEVIPKEEYEKFVKAKKEWLRAFSSELKQRVNASLMQVKFPSFSERLLDLLDRHKDLLANYIYDFNGFTKKVKSYRNFLAHDHSDKSRQEIDEKDLRYFTDCLRIIFEVNFLKVLGLPDEKQQQRLKRSFVFGDVANKMPEMKSKYMIK